ncbi:hypothetical protein KY290_010867 [Solanum tuberosum]|uniref:Integrase catalytic domain-containing protein n=1 Tax=Solanum tuberosum TaxID=4113 RepID=A0ABQ7W111_SOLTU|nr:hypothetical protein KY290_010867 [Solanum tuberosum]
MQNTTGEDVAMYVDSGATTHMTNTSGNLSDLQIYNGTDKIIVGNGEQLAFTHVGNLNKSDLKVKDILVVSKITKNLLSVSKLAKDNSATLEFDEFGFLIKDKKSGTPLAKGSNAGGLYQREDNNLFALTTTQDWKKSKSIWHSRLGHLSLKSLKNSSSNKCIDVRSWNKVPSICTSCQLGKSCKLSFELRNKIEQILLHKIHCDLWGPKPIESSQHMKYYVIFVDNNTRYTSLYPLKKKFEFFEVFLKFQQMVERQFSKPIKIFQCDGGGEFIQTEFVKHLENYAIIRQISCPHTPEQNGVSERKHRHIVETSLKLLFHAKLPQFLWVEAFLTIAFLINRMPSLVLKNGIPFVKLFSASPDYNSLKVFGCKCYPYLKGKTKFSPKTYPCIFIGYSSLHKGYRCYHPQTRRVYVSRHVIFDELALPYVQTDKRNINVSPHLATFLEFFSTVQNPDTSSSDTITLGEMLDNLTETIAPATITVVDT